MSQQLSSQTSSSVKNSVSFPNTRAQTMKPLTLESRLLKFQPVRSDVLLKELLEYEEEHKKYEKTNATTSCTNLQKSRETQNDTVIRDKEYASPNLLNVAITEDEPTAKNACLVPGVNWLDTHSERKPFKIVTKQCPHTPVSNMSNKLLVKNESSTKKDCIKKGEANINPINNIFKTPVCKNSNIIASVSGSSSQKHPTNIVAARKCLPDFSTPKNIETPQQNSIIQSARRNYFSLRTNSCTPTVLREKQMNDVTPEKQKEIAMNKENPVSIKQPSSRSQILQNSTAESSYKILKIRGKDYIIMNKIGEGGSGQVIRCFERETLQDRAVKIVNLNGNPTTVNGYISEVKMLKELQGNERVIKMFDYEQVNQTLFVVMEKGDVDFSVFLKNIISAAQIKTHIIICYWVEMLECVKEIHKKGIIHSDLKPSNFLIVGGRLKLIDFGIASRLSCDMTSVVKSVQVGTLNYISPEAIIDSRESPSDENLQLKISYKSDVWSLGCILYQMVYRKTPFHHVMSAWAKCAIIADPNHVINYPEVKGVPLYLIEMIKKCLVFDMKSRPTVDELLTMYDSISGNCR